jgi:hypothetical protein
MLRGLSYTASFFARAAGGQRMAAGPVSPVGVTGCAVAVWVYGELRAAPHHHLSVPFGQSIARPEPPRHNVFSVTPHRCALHELCSRAHLSYFTALYSFCKQ